MKYSYVAIQRDNDRKLKQILAIMHACIKCESTSSWLAFDDMMVLLYIGVNALHCIIHVGLA